MIIIPEIETVVILTPRTGSGSLRRAIKVAYPQSMQLYRHMEADGIPQGYDRWKRVGVVRDPIERLWSLYKFLRNYGSDNHDPAFIASMRACASVSFDDFILKNETVFTSPYDSAGRGRFWPHYTCRHPIPENRKSQFMYLRPDLGTQIYRYQDDNIARDLRVTSFLLRSHNRTSEDPVPPMSYEALEYMERVFYWDFAMARSDAKRELV